VGRAPAFVLSTSTALGTFATYFVTLTGSIAVYRVSPFHPLAKYPGPFIAKLSKLWMVHSFICLSVFYMKYEELIDIHSYSFAQPENRTNTMRNCTRNTGILYAQVNYFPPHFVYGTYGVVKALTR
jgi:hypothetical protein